DYYCQVWDITDHYIF
nr:immunoglobulin light chain junction region [Macaca mulatta]MOX43074.1 immunoglobulin light chain junction region [Macaca mulatta]MOX43441.1 immunoglobulin light chain junction region [Macaca mulatta]MOX44444.1 immunoglobulin light chain junction region [Macaca mulatta]MOX44597.1 immunoglobulin light chain junction region [Macaca mulatta]